jgi:D-serine/D-alanine/glycine transporter
MIRIGIEFTALGKFFSGSLVSAAVVPTSSTPTKAKIAICLLLGAALQYFVPNTVEAFTLATTLSTILFICVWIMIIWSYIVYYKTRPELHAKSTFKLPGGLFTCWFVIVFFIGVIYVLSLEADTMKALMVSPIWFIILIIGYFGFYKPKHK